MQTTEITLFLLKDRKKLFLRIFLSLVMLLSLFQGAERYVSKNNINVLEQNHYAVVTWGRVEK